MTTAHVHAPAMISWNEESIGADELVGRLYRAGEQAVADMIASLTPSERVTLAMFCYHKSHLHRIGLAIAATCDLSTLVRALGTVIGGTLFAQSRQPSPAPARAPSGNRPKVSLAAASTPLPIDWEIDDPDDELENVPEADEGGAEAPVVPEIANITELG